MLDINNIEWDGRVAKCGEIIVAEWNTIDKELVLSHHWVVENRVLTHVNTLDDAKSRLDVLKATQKAKA